MKWQKQRKWRSTGWDWGSMKDLPKGSCWEGGIRPSVTAHRDAIAFEYAACSKSTACLVSGRSLVAGAAAVLLFCAPLNIALKPRAFEGDFWACGSSKDQFCSGLDRLSRVLETCIATWTFTMRFLDVWLVCQEDSGINLETLEYTNMYLNVMKSSIFYQGASKCTLGGKDAFIHFGRVDCTKLCRCNATQACIRGCNHKIFLARTLPSSLIMLIIPSLASGSACLQEDFV